MAIGDVELRQLRYFTVAAEELHVGRASARLFISQPALSKQIRHLEREFGVPLFHRHPRGLTLTAEGSAVLAEVRATLEAAARLTDLVQRVRGRLNGRLGLGFVGQAANELTPVMLRRYGEAHPDVEVDLRQYTMDDVSAGLTTREVDLAIIRLPITLRGIVLQELFVEPRVAVLPDGHRLVGRDDVGVQDLFAEPWLRPGSTDPVYRDFALARSQRRDPPVLGPVVRTIDELLEAVLAGRGVCLAPASAARYYSRPGVTYVPVLDAEPSVVALAWLREPARLSPNARAFIDLSGSLAAFRSPDGPAPGG